MAYATVPELRADMNMTGTGDDTTLARILDAATRAIDRFCRRPDGFIADSNATARIYAGSDAAWQWIDECVAVTLVRHKDSATSNYDTWASTDWMAATGDPNNPDFQPLVSGRPYTALMVDPNGDEDVFHRAGSYPTVEVTARWGYAVEVPPDIQEACIMQAARWYKRLQSAMADTVASAEFGQLMFRRPLDPDIQMILENGRYVRPTVG